MHEARSLAAAVILLSGALVSLLGLGAGWEPDPSRTLYFPQVAVHGGASTAFLLHNPGPGSVAADLDMRDSQGHVMESLRLQIPAGATRRLEFGGEDGKALEGWARIRSTGDLVATELIQAGPSPWIGFHSTEPVSGFRFSGRVDLPGMRTGVALANPNPGSVSITARLYGRDGELVRSGEFDLAALAHRSG